MNELSLFTGAGGGLLGTSLLGWNPIGYVEWNEYCQRVIAARIADGILPAAPIFTDVREFVQSGAAAEYRGVTGVVTAGFPCQPFSLAGKQLGAADPRNMWPATIAVIRAVRPQFALLENVPAIITSGYFGTILGDLAESGYDCRWRILSAGEMGALHRRDRLWLVAHAKQVGCKTRALFNGQEKLQPSMDVYMRDKGKIWQGWDKSEPHGVADGVAYRVDRLEAIGNGQVPATVAAVWRLLTGDLNVEY